MKPIFTLRAQMNLYADSTQDAFAALAEHFDRLATGEAPDEKVFCGGMMTLDPAEGAPSGCLVPAELMRLIVKCGGNVQLLPQHERFMVRRLLASWAKHEKMMAPPSAESDEKGVSDGGSNSEAGATAPVSEP